MMMGLYVVPSLKAKGTLIGEAESWAASIGAVFVPRRGQTVEQLRRRYGTEHLLIYTSRGPVIERDEGKHFFSLNMAELRIQQLRKGKPDHLLEAFGADRPVSVLDATCGFGADAIVASFGLPAGSAVTALEAVPQMAAVTGWGFSHFVHETCDVTQALRRITLYNENYRTYLANCQKPYDIIYFDPMFSQPVQASCQFQPVRAIMDHEELTMESLERAMHISKRVVVKGRYLQPLLQVFPSARIMGGRYSHVRYAVLEGKIHG